MSPSASSDRTRQWWMRPSRVLLINLREGDEPRIEAEALVREAKEFHATAFCISGGGIVAFYQTQIAGHRKSSALGNRDLLAEIIPVAHREGLHVLARMDPSCAPKALCDEHPEWFSRDRTGRLVEVSGHYVTCPNSGYYHERIVEVAAEMLARYGVDGIWNNQGKFAAWDTGSCYCDTCRSLFRVDTGHEIPLAEDWQSAAWIAFNEWRYQRIAAWVEHMHREIHAVKADAVFIAAVQLMESLETIRPGGWDVDYWVEHQDVLTFECQRRNTAPWWPGMQAKYLAGLAPNGPRWMTASYFYPWWRLYAAPEAENRPWIAQQFANGVSTWLHINGGYSQLFDRRGLAPMRAVFARLAKWEPYFDGASSAAEVAIVFSRHTQDIYGGAKPHARYLDCVRGYYCALQEAHIAFDVLSDKRLDEATLARYRVIVLPNTAVMSADVAAALQRYVEKGGGLVATFETAACGLDGAMRPESALAGTLGVERVGYRDNLQSSYSRIENSTDPLCCGLGDTDLIANDGALVEVRPHPGRATPLTLIPPVIAHDGATISIPEYSAISVASSAIPVAVRGASGRGRTVYFANRMDALFYRYGFRDLGVVLANAVRYALGGAPSLEVDAPDYVDVTLMAQAGRRMVHLINLPLDKPVNSGWRHPGRNLVPVSDIVVRLRAESGQVVSCAKLGSTGGALELRWRDNCVEVRVPLLEDHEIIVFELQKES